MDAHTNLDALAILVLPHEDWYHKRHSLIGPHPYTQVLAHLEPHTLTYSPSSKLPNTPHEDQAQNHHIIGVQQMATPTILPIFIERFQYCLEIALCCNELPLRQNTSPLTMPTKVNIFKRW